MQETEFDDEGFFLLKPKVQAASRIAWSLLVVALLIASSCFLSVRERTSVIVTRFGRPVREISQPGPAWQWPWPFEEAHVIDLRARILETPATATLTRDKKTVVLLTYAVWKVAEPLLYLRASGGRDGAERKIASMISAAKNVQMGRFDLRNLVSTRPEDLKVEAIEEAIREQVSASVREKLGVEILQVGFQRVAYPEENTPAVLDYMRSERKAVADKLRAEGDRDASRIRDEALVRTEEILAQGRVEAGKIRGEAERDSARIYSEAHKRNPEFYRFWRSIQAAEQAISKQTTVVLRSDQDFFQALSQDKAPSPATGAEP